MNTPLYFMRVLDSKYFLKVQILKNFISLKFWFRLFEVAIFLLAKMKIIEDRQKMSQWPCKLHKNYVQCRFQINIFFSWIWGLIFSVLEGWTYFLDTPCICSNRSILITINWNFTVSFSELSPYFCTVEFEIHVINILCKTLYYILLKFRYKRAIESFNKSIL